MRSFFLLPFSRFLDAARITENRERETAAQKYVSMYKSLHMHGRILDTGCVFPSTSYLRHWYFIIVDYRHGNDTFPSTVVWITKLSDTSACPTSKRDESAKKRRRNKRTFHFDWHLMPFSLLNHNYWECCEIELHFSSVPRYISPFLKPTIKTRSSPRFSQ